MAEDVLITFLPSELLEYILQDENLSITDVINFAVACKQTYRVIVSINKLWKTKFFQRWPNIVEAYEEQRKQGMNIQNWYEEVKCSFHSIAEMQRLLANMSAQNYHKHELSDVEFREFDKLFRPEEGAHQLAYHVLVDELIKLINQPVLESNLTHVYYAHKVIRYMRQDYLTNEWNKFISLSTVEQIFEKGAALVAQWSQPERQVSYLQICKTLDNIAEQTKTAVRLKNPGHSIFSAPRERLEAWKRLNIDDNQWSPNESREIVMALCDIMFNKLEFEGNSEMYYSSENSFIDRVLERRRGIPIVLAIIFESIARRLGIRCEHISFPAHSLLRWKEKYKADDSESVESVYIDVFNRGQFITKRDCPRISAAAKCPIEKNNSQESATAVEIVARMAGNLEVAGRQRTHLNGRAARLRSALELMHMVRPHDTGVILHLARFYMLHQMDLSKLVRVLHRLQTESEITLRGPANQILQMLQDYKQHMTVPEEELVVKIRTPEVKFAVGMIMIHVRYNYTCVIIGWDTQCERSPQWMDEMGSQELSGGATQPFYNVLTNDGSWQYNAQENLMMASAPCSITHEGVGRFFSKFTNLCYIPNEEKEKEYPGDAQVRNKLVTQAYQRFMK